MCCPHGLPRHTKSHVDMPTAAKNIEPKRTRRAALNSHTIRIGRHRDETYSTRTRCSGSGALSEDGPAVRPSTFPTRTHNRLTAVVRRLRNLHPWPPLHSEGDRKKRFARFCVEPLVGTTSCRRKAILRDVVLRNPCGRKSTKSHDKGLHEQAMCCLHGLPR